MENLTFKLPISPKKIAMVFLAIVIFLVMANIVGQYYKDAFAGNEIVLKIIRKFNLDLEKNNVPTWYQSSTLLLSSFLLLIVTLVRREKKDSDFRYWGVLSAIFLYLSLDEAVSIHEQLTMPLRTTFDLGGFFYLSWVIPAGIFLVIFFFVFLKFLLRLPSETRFLMITAGMIFVFGAVGVEMLGGEYLYLTNDLPTRVNDFRYALLTTVEETLEMLGIVIFIYTLLSYLSPQEAEARVLETTKPIKHFEGKIALNQ